jgi:hypothetical protein
VDEIMRQADELADLLGHQGRDVARVGPKEAGEEEA